MITIIHKDDPLTVVRHRETPDGVLCAALEFYRAEEAAAVAAFLEEALRSAEPQPATLAHFVDRRLREAGPESGLPSWVMFSAVLATPDRVEVCMAGAHRIHLVESGRVLSTREHILRSDEPPLSWSAEFAATIDLALQGGIVTRTLGKPESRPAETTVWTVAAPYRVVLCSTAFHAEGTPSDYLAELAAGLPSRAGAVAVLDCKL